ncbi:hypothetical protein [Streptomyces sp. NPDC046371]|uniref:hypothetical protein n=1 Tax=unclassified Streptomyces TaxID=2593676 RepID=UPI0033F37FF0
MTDTPSTIERHLAGLCGGDITSEDYTGYFLNEHGEELVFAQRRGERTARLWHSDMDWQLYRVGDHSIRVGGTGAGLPDGVLDGLITVEGLIIDRAEASWLASCLAASRHLRR